MWQTHKLIIELQFKNKIKVISHGIKINVFLTLYANNSSLLFTLVSMFYACLCIQFRGIKWSTFVLFIMCKNCGHFALICQNYCVYILSADADSRGFLSPNIHFVSFTVYSLTFLQVFVGYHKLLFVFYYTIGDII